METSIATKLDDAFTEFKSNQKTELQKQSDLLQKQSDKLGEVDDTLNALIQKQTKMPGDSTSNDTVEKTKGFEKFLRTGNRQALTKSMEIATDAAGGYTHIPELGKEIIASVARINPLLSEIERITIHANKYEQIFTTSRTANARAAENDERTETSTAHFEKNTIELFDLYSYPRITNELLDSSAFKLDAWLRQDIQESFNEALAIEFVSGDGVKKSVGLLNSTSSNVVDGTPALAWGSFHTEAATTSVTYADLLSVISSLPARYKASNNCKWYMSTAGIEAIRSLVDGNGLPIWRQDFGIAGAPQVLLGYSVVEVPQLDTTAFPLMFGDLRQAYKFIAHEKGLGIIVDQITEPGFTKFYASLQCAGGVMDSRAMVALELS